MCTDHTEVTQLPASRGRTSNLWLLTFLPFLFQTILGCGSPVAWHTKEATPPWTPVWSSGVRVNLGGAVWEHMGKKSSEAPYDNQSVPNQHAPTPWTTCHVSCVLINQRQHADAVIGESERRQCERLSAHASGFVHPSLSVHACARSTMFSSLPMYRQRSLIFLCHKGFMKTYS